MTKYFIIDFDSTFIQSEGLEELAVVVLKNRTDRDEIIEEIKKITCLGMEGRISFEDSLKKRLKLLKGNRLHIEEVVKILKKKISASIKRNRQFFKQFKDKIYIISGGFREFILPIIKPFEIEKSHVLANKFVLDKEGKIIGLDSKNPLARDEGKVKVVNDLGLKGEIIVIGDGYTDYQIKAMGGAKHFVAFTENVKRTAVLEKADHIAPNFDEFLFINKLPRSLSYPKNRVKALLIGDVGGKMLQLFKKEGYQIMKSTRRVDRLEKIKKIHILLIANFSSLKEKILDKANLLMVIGILGKEKLIDTSILNKKAIALFFGQENNLGRKILEFINTGDTYTSLNIPHVRLRKEKNTHRLLHLHQNVPGILAKINGIMAKYNINILAQFLKTNKEIGYVITDVNKQYDKKVLKELKLIPNTIRFRVLY
ncbi:HAD-IB family phosphatase [Candidatus Roizmanbacteria bacterium]|nr:HAD-IB family phosphatase [Candidatus Roizmanbacteria bacterium]